MDDALQPGPAPTAHGGGMNLLHLAWQRRGVLLAGLLFGAAVGVVAHSRRPPVYRSSAQVLVVKRQSSSVLLVDGNTQMPALEDYVSTHLIVLRSPDILTRAVAKGQLGTLRSLQGGNPVATIQAGLAATREVSRATASTVITLTYSGSDPHDTEAVLNAVIASYREFLEETYKDNSDKTAELLRSAIDSLSAELKAKREEHRKFRMASPAALVDETGAPTHRRALVAAHQKEALAAREVQELAALLAEIEQAQAAGAPSEMVLTLATRKVEPAPPVGPKLPDRELQMTLFTLKQQEAELTQFYGQDHPDVLRLRARIKQTREFQQELMLSNQAEKPSAAVVAGAVAAVRSRHRAALAAHKLVAADLGAMLARAPKLEDDVATDKGLRDDIARVTGLLDAAQRRMSELTAVRGYGGFEARAIGPPEPGAKVAPVFWQFLVMGSVLGLGAGGATAYLLDLADKSFRSPDEVRRRLGLQILGHIPLWTPTDAAPVTDAAGRKVELDPGLVALLRPDSPEAESFRGVRTALFFREGQDRPRVIQMTSPNMGDGKTTLTANLAVSIAQSGRTVVIVDADLRRPRVHRVFGAAGRPGLSEVITGAAELGNAVVPTVVPNLWVLPSGRRPPNPAELLTTPRFEDVLDELREAYDYVLVDTSPLLAVSDPCIVASRVDGLILTIRVTRSERPAAERARDLLAGLKVNYLGIVLNGLGAPGARGGYGYGPYAYTTNYAPTDAEPDHAEPDRPARPAASEADSDAW